MLISPSIVDLTKGKYNAYTIVIAAAKGARMVTDEYVAQREAAEKSATGNKEADRNLINMINKEYRDEKAVKNAITRLNSGEYKIVRVEPTEDEAETDVEKAEATKNTEADAE
jgi:hypothetical protein